MKIYLDACCLNRPFDNHAQDRVRLESEAVLTILTQIGILSSLLKPLIIIDENVEKRAISLEDLGFGSYDALHIACAEKGKANILLSTDDRFLNKSFQHKDILKVRVENSVKWLMEVSGK